MDGGNALMVKLEPGLHPSRLVGPFHNIATLPGVLCVVDLASIDRGTLDVLLLQRAKKRKDRKGGPKR